MPYDREDFFKSIAAQRETTQRALLPQAHALHASAVSMELLTRDEHWNRYLTLLQGMRDSVEARKRDAEKKQSDPSVWDPKDLYKLKSDVLRADAMLDLMDTIMGLPKALHDGGEKAVEMIQKFEENDDRSTPAETPQS